MKLATISVLAFGFVLAGCAPDGACLMGSAHDWCTEDHAKKQCDQGSSNEFHPGATCASLGYSSQSGATWRKPDK